MTKTAAVVWGSEPPAFSIGYVEPLSPADSGFSVLFADAPDPHDVPHDGEELPEGIAIVCLTCLLNAYPEIGRGLDLARVYGAADLDDDGEWAGRKLYELEDD